MSSEVALKVADISKCYQIYARPQDRLMQSLWRGRRQFYREFWALHDVSFEVGKGEAVGIIGRNGSGKSTLLQIIAGTLSPTAGSVEVNGRIAALLELGSGFSPEFTGRENVYMNGAILGLGHREIERRFGEIEAFADIGDFIDQPVKTYSSGMLMRLAFAVSVNVEPEVLIIDEALAVGDMGFQFKCLDRLSRLIGSGATLLFVSHDLGLVKAFCRRAIYLANGQLRAAGAADEVAELYLLDMRDEQKRSLAGDAAVVPKSFLGETRGIAFGTNQGRITAAHFVDTGATRSAFAFGDEIQIKVSVEHDGTLHQPALSALVQDRRMIPITGKTFMISRRADGDGLSHTTVLFTVRALFESGTYFVTLRLEDRLAQTSFVPVDKQVGLLSFEIVKSQQQDFLGIVDTAVTCRELPEGP